MHKTLRSALLAGLTGTFMVSTAWAGMGLGPVSGLDQGKTSPRSIPGGGLGMGGASGAARHTLATGASVGTPAVAAPGALASGQLLVGAAKNSMAPRPQDMAQRFPGARWETDPAKCKTLEPAWVKDVPTAALNALDGAANPGSTWPENPNCIYMGGFGLGPMNPVRSFDQQNGLWVRSVALSDGAHPLVMTVVDAEGWLWDYRSKCTDCGAKQISEALAADPELTRYGVTPASFLLHATHSHSAPDFIGGWGFVPNWYMAQITDTIKATAKQALRSMEPATLETGEITARGYNSERRGTYRSAEEQQISWLRAVAAPAAQGGTSTAGAVVSSLGEGDAGNADETPSPSSSQAASPARVIATLGAYAAHPTTRGTNGGVASADWVGDFEKRLETRFGGIGLHFMTGLGNMSAAGGDIGFKLADLLPPVGAGQQVANPAIRLTRTTYRSPITNVPLDTLGTAGLFDRKFDPIPASVAVGKSATAPCVSASAQSVELPVTVAKIGSQIVLTTGPGEEFANLTNSIKEHNPQAVTFPLAQVNDALGYMPQSFEVHPVGQQALGFFAGGYLFVNYEDSYAIDRCLGDGLLELTLHQIDALK